MAHPDDMAAGRGAPKPRTVTTVACASCVGLGRAGLDEPKQRAADDGHAPPVEAAEKRKNSSLMRDVQVALPWELNDKRSPPSPPYKTNQQHAFMRSCRACVHAPRSARNFRLAVLGKDGRRGADRTNRLDRLSREAAERPERPPRLLRHRPQPAGDEPSYRLLAISGLPCSAKTASIPRQTRAWTECPVCAEMIFSAVRTSGWT